MTQRLFFGVLLVGLVVGAKAQTTGPLAIEERNVSASSGSSSAAVSGDGVLLLMQQLQMQEQEIANLRGMLEQVAQELEVMRQAERERFIDLDMRINALASPAAVQAKGAAEAPVGEKDSEADRLAYVVAKDQLVSGKREQAASKFEQYLTDHPKGQFVSYAHFWLGEIYRGMGAPKRDLAMKHLSAVIEDYPGSSKVAAAMYKRAVLEYESGDQTRAKVTLNTLVQKFPNASEAGLAKSMLDQLK